MVSEELSTRRAETSSGGDPRRGASAEGVGEDRLDEPPEDAVPRVLHVRLGHAAADAAVLLEHVGEGDAKLAAVVLEELLAEGRVPEHDVLPVGRRDAALEVVVQLFP